MKQMVRGKKDTGTCPVFVFTGENKLMAESTPLTE